MRQILGPTLSALLASPAFAAGEIELNHTCATTTGCVIGDSPGYPIEAPQRGSYRLTSDLVVPAGSEGIVFDEGASLDLGGFTVAGPVSCPLGGCPPSAGGVGIYGGAGNAITNGRVSGFGSNCIEVGRGSRVERVNVTECAQHGIVAGGGSYVASNQIDLIGKKGIQFLIPFLPPSSAGVYRDNTIGVTGDLSVENGRASGPNTCLDQKCGTSGKKRVYLTTTTHNGAAATNACAAGFHMASLLEIWDPTEFEYDETRGFLQEDQGQGPPAFQGWIRTAQNGNNAVTTILGNANCDAWTTTNVNGTVGMPFGGWSAPSTQVSPWNAEMFACSSLFRVWCAQD